jgi:hypothetical protein
VSSAAVPNGRYDCAPKHQTRRPIMSRGTSAPTTSMTSAPSLHVQRDHGRRPPFEEARGATTRRCSRWSLLRCPRGPRSCRRAETWAESHPEFGGTESLVQPMVRRADLSRALPIPNRADSLRGEHAGTPPAHPASSGSPDVLGSRARRRMQ